MCVAHVILGCKPISSSFQSPKYVIKARDPRLPLIDIVVPGFIAGSLPKGTQHIYLTNLQAAEEELIPLDFEQEKQEETVRVLEAVDLEEDFNVFSRVLEAVDLVEDFNVFS